MTVEVTETSPIVIEVVSPIPGTDWAPAVGALQDRVTAAEDALAAHEDAPTPHPAYDVDIQDLTVLLENGLI